MSSQDIAEAKGRYTDFCRLAEGLPLFLQPFWLDALCGAAHWYPLLYCDKAGEVVAAMPLTFARKWGLRIIQKPPLTPWLGPWIAYPPHAATGQARFSLEQKVYDAFMAQMPRTSYAKHTFHPCMTNWLPFCWQGYRQQTRYTFQLDLEQGEEALFAGFKRELRSRIRQGSTRIAVRADAVPPSEVHRALRDTLARQESTLGISAPGLAHLYEALLQRQQGMLLSAHDRHDGSAKGYLLLCWDAGAAYALVLCSAAGQADDSSSMPYLIWEGIRCAAAKGIPVFDFEGSMIPGVARFFSTFGAEPVPYFQLERYGHPLLERMLLLLRGG